MVHYELEFIHPFSDGNGRLGRLWQHVMLLAHSPVFSYLPTESVIRDRQQDYYAALRAADKAGDSTVFIEFALDAIRVAIHELAHDVRPVKHDAATRLEIARTHFGSEMFTRKDYRDLHRSLSTATASRDLKLGVDDRSLTKRGDRALANYRFNIKP